MNHNQAEGLLLFFEACMKEMLSVSLVSVDKATDYTESSLVKCCLRHIQLALTMISAQQIL